MALHTRASLVPAIVERTKTDHPYEVPCVIALPILGGNPDYLAWIEQETRAAEEPRTTSQTPSWPKGWLRGLVSGERSELRRELRVLSACAARK